MVGSSMMQGGMMGGYGGGYGMPGAYGMGQWRRRVWISIMKHPASKYWTCR